MSRSQVWRFGGLQARSGEGGRIMVLRFLKGDLVGLGSVWRISSSSRLDKRRGGC